MKKISIWVVLLLVGIVGNVAAQDQHGPKDWYWNTKNARRTGELLEQASKRVAKQAAKIAKIGKNVIFKYSYAQLQAGRAWIIGGNYFGTTPDTVRTKTDEKICPVVNYVENAEEKTMAISIRQDCFDEFYKDIEKTKLSLTGRYLLDIKTNQTISMSDEKCSQKRLAKNIIFTCKL